MKYLELFAKNLKLYRNKRNLTQAQLAEKLNVHVSTIARIETAEHQISAKNIDRIVEILDISYREFFDYSMPEEIHPAKDDLLDKMNMLAKTLPADDLQYFITCMKNYISLKKSRKNS